MKANSKKQVLDICKESYNYLKTNKKLSDDSLRIISTGLAISSFETVQLISSLSHLIATVLFNNQSSFESISTLFPDSFHANLKQLLSKILVECLPQWRVDAVNNSVSLPRLVDFDWKVALKVDESTRANTPSCILQLQIEDPIKEVKRDCAPESRKSTVKSVELSRETLETILHGLGRIRDQLAVVAKK